MSIETIFFDVGGTLVHPDMSSLMAPLLTRVTPTREQLMAADRAAKHSYRPNGDGTGSGNAINTGHWYLYFKTLLQSLEGCDDLLPELTARANNSSHWSLLGSGAIDTLQKLQRRYRLAVISNADGRIEAVLSKAGILHFFEKVVDSGLVGCEKPDPRIFQAALKEMKADASRSLYVGDMYGIDYCGATAVGMKAVLMDPDGVYRDFAAPRIDSLSALPAWLAMQE